MKHTDEYYAGLLVGLKCAISQQMEQNSDTDRCFIEKTYRLLKHEMEE